MRWIIGDIHGMVRPLETLIRAVERNDPEPRLMFVGDYVNRGPDSRAVIELLLSLDDAQFVRGNHDDVLDQVLNGQSYAGKPGEDQRAAAFRWFIQHGLDKTLHSYGVTPRDLTHVLRRPRDRALDELAASVPAEHRRWFRNLPPVIEHDDLFVAHAKWDVFNAVDDPPIAQRLIDSEAARYTLLWGRYRADELDFNKPWRRTGYFGHTPVDNYAEMEKLIPIAGPQIVLLDTAAALVPHGRLTAFCHETRSFIQTDASGKLAVPG